MQRFSQLLVIAGIALTGLSFGCRSSQPDLTAPKDRSVPDRSTGQSTATFTPADQANAPLLPDPKMTPGATLPVTKDDLCVPGYAKKVRNVPASVKNQAYAEYGISSHKPGEYEVDHLISLELGGSNSIKNLWPQSYQTQPWNAHVKDALENRLHADVCAGTIDLATAQHEIATDWIAAYKKRFGTNLPLAKDGGSSNSGRTSGRMPHPLTDDMQSSAPANSPTPTQGAAATNGQVWVNLNSGKYFRPNSKYYGHTKHGQYLSEAAAQKQGYVAAQGQ